MPIESPKKIIETISIHGWWAGLNKNIKREIAFIIPKISTGTFLRPLKNLSDINPDKNVPTIADTELTEIIELASTAVYPL